jgi:hypothetical protein
MNAVDKAAETQLANIQTKTGEPLSALYEAVLGQGLSKHAEMLAWVKSHYGLGHGDANTLVHMARRSVEPAPQEADPLDALYVGPKAHQRAIHEALMARITEFGPFEIAPKKANVSLRRARQFALLGPKTKDRFELGLNLKEDAAHPLMTAARPGGMCQYFVALTAPEQIDDALMALVRRAYDAAG